MKKLIYTLLLLSLSLAFTTVNAQKGIKIESSQRKAPKWINSLEKDYIIIVGTGSSVDKAQEDALIRIKEHIIRAVAENVQFESKMTRKEDMFNNISSYAENYESTTKSQSTDVSFVKGISLSKAEEFYWEVRQDKSTKTTIAHYHVKYPFADTELKKLVMAFEKIDRELTKQLNTIIDEIPMMTSIERMEGAIKELEQLKERFIDPRQDQAATGISRITARLKSIVVFPETNNLGEIVYSLRIGEQIVTGSKKPSVLVPNKCATITNIEPTESGWKILYDPQYCYDDPNNMVTVKHTIRFNNLKHDFHFDINDNKVEVFMHSDIMMNGTVEGDVATNVKIKFIVTTKYDSPFVIDQIVLKYDRISPISFDNINKSFSGKGDHELELTVDKDLPVAEYSSSKSPMVNGMIYYSSKKSGEKFTYKLYKHTVTTNF